MPELKHSYPDYPLKSEFTPGTWSENDGLPGEKACVDRVFYSLPDGTEYAVFKIVERTMTGKKRQRWETWQNGSFSNNYFTCFEDAVKCVDGRIGFWGFPGKRHDYAVYPYIKR